MAALVWVMMGIALWHFAIFVPDHFWSGIVGAFVGAVIGALVFGFLVHGLTVPGQDDTDLINALEAIPGAIAGMAVVYFIGRRDAARDDPCRSGCPRCAGGRDSADALGPHARCVTQGVEPADAGSTIPCARARSPRRIGTPSVGWARSRGELEWLVRCSLLPSPQCPCRGPS